MMAFGGDAGLALYNVESWAAGAVDLQLTSLSPVSVLVLYGAGLLSALSPCALTLLPPTLAYLSNEAKDAGPEGDNSTLLVLSSIFAVGLAAALAALGLVAISVGQLFGTVGTGPLLPLGAALVSVACGLNLLDLLEFKLPSLPFSTPSSGDAEATPMAVKGTRAFAFGASSARVSSPCSTPGE